MHSALIIIGLGLNTCIMAIFLCVFIGDPLGIPRKRSAGFAVALGLLVSFAVLGLYALLGALLKVSIS